MAVAAVVVSLGASVAVAATEAAAHVVAAVA